MAFHSDYVVRQAKVCDAESISSIGSLTFRRAYAAVVEPEDMIGYVEQMFAPSRIASEIGQSDSLYFIAEAEGVVLGYAKLAQTSVPDLRPERNLIELVRLYIDDHHFDKGIGGRLLTAVRTAAIERGYSGLWLRVWEKNRGAIRFYHRHGFETVGSEPYLIGETANPVALMFEATRIGSN